MLGLPFPNVIKPIHNIDNWIKHEKELLIDKPFHELNNKASNIIYDLGKSAEAGAKHGIDFAIDNIIDPLGKRAMIFSTPMIFGVVAIVLIIFMIRRG